MNQEKEITWDTFDEFTEVIHKYMEPEGQGKTLSSQAVTAVNKLVYKWFNDGDVYDNRFGLSGWANDLSSYANWLQKHITGTLDILSKITTIKNDEEYQVLLYDLCKCVLNEEKLQKLSQKEAKGDIYDCEGVYKFIESYDEEEDY